MPKRVLTGTVVSDKGDKTVVVRVERRVKHPLYGKIIKLSKKYHAHDEGNAFKAGEQVRIEECAPISKLKSWTVLDRVGAARWRSTRSSSRTVQAVAEPKAEKPAKAKAAKGKAKRPSPKRPKHGKD